LRRRIADNVSARIDPLMRNISGKLFRGADRRIYFRIFDFNGSAWKMARRQAEPHRRKLYDLFDREALDAMLPAPDADLHVQDGIIDYSGPKLLVGLCLWAARNL